MVSDFYTPLTALVALAFFATSSVVAQEDTPVFGKVTTNKKTALKAAPNAHAAAARTVDANMDLRWVMGDRKGKYVRVMIPRGASGWVLEADVNKVAEADLASIALEASAQPCVTPESLNACTSTKPTGCSPAGSAHGKVNELKRTVPPEGTPTTLTFETFSQLQSVAVESVDQGVEIPPAERDKIKSIETAEGTVGEGSRVRLVAFLSEGTPQEPQRDQWPGSPARGSGRMSSSPATETHPAPCISTPSTGRPQSQASAARHGSEMLPILGFPCSSVG
jgi:hypothetical protein